MPIRADRQCLHDLAAICLHGVQVLDRHVEQRATETVVNARDELLLVLPLLEPGDHVRLAGENRRDEARNVFRLELQIGRVEDEHLGAGFEVARPQRVGDSTPNAMTRKPQKRVLGGQRLQHVPRVVLGSIVDDDDLVADIR